MTLRKHSRDGGEESNKKIKGKVPGKLSFMEETEIFAMSGGDDNM